MNTSLPPAPLLVKLPVAAKLLGLSEKTVWTLAKSGTIPSIKIGASRRFPVAAIESWVATQLELRPSQLFGGPGSGTSPDNVPQ